MEKKYSIKKFSVSKIYEIQHVFELFDYEYAGLNSYDDLWVAVMSLGYLVSEARIQAIIAQHDVNKSGFYDISTFFMILSALHQNQESMMTLTKLAFNSLPDNPSGHPTLPLSTFNQMMSSIGEPLSAGELAEVKRIAKFDEPSGEIDLSSLAQVLMSAKLIDGTKDKETDQASNNKRVEKREGVRFGDNNGNDMA
jgi:Ca2+-binding EF-hand superfamily protein